MILIRSLTFAFFVGFFPTCLKGQTYYDTLNSNIVRTKFFNDSTGQKFSNYIEDIIIYPNSNDRLSGIVLVEFMVDATGNITNIKILKSLRQDYDQAVVDALKISPKWTPAMKNGKPVKCVMKLPIHFFK